MQHRWPVRDFRCGRDRTIDIDTLRATDEAIVVLRARLTPLTPRTRFELVTRRSFTGIVNEDRVRIWPMGPSGGEDGMWHQWRPVFNGFWTERHRTSHLVGKVSLNHGVYGVIGIVAIVVGAWLFAGLRAELLGLARHTALDPMLVFAGVAMPVLFGLVAFGIFWTSYRLYLADRAELQAFLEGAFAETAAPDSTND